MTATRAIEKTGYHKQVRTVKAENGESRRVRSMMDERHDS